MCYFKIWCVNTIVKMMIYKIDMLNISGERSHITYMIIFVDTSNIVHIVMQVSLLSIYLPVVFFLFNELLNIHNMSKTCYIL